MIPPLPTGLLAAALLFWGWRTQFLALALPLALLLELAPWVRWRWALNDRELARVIDLTALLWLGTLAYLFSRYLNQPPLALHLYRLASWLPLLLFPPLAIQRYSTAGAFRFGHLFYSLRRSTSALARRPLTLDLLYFIACLLAAAVPLDPGYLWGAGMLLAWLLIAARPRRQPLTLTLTLALAAGAAAYPLSSGLHRLQLGLEEELVALFEDWFLDVDPYRSSTALGDIGVLKISGRVVLRLRPLTPADRGPWLLRAASYNSYFDAVWRARETRFTRIASEGDGQQWPLAVAPPANDASRSMAIALDLRQGAGMLPLPLGAYRLERLPVGDLQTNGLGAIKAENGPGLVNYRVWTHPAAQRDAPPTEQDLALPRPEQPTLERLAAELGLKGQPSAVAVAKVRHFLHGQFRYSLELPAPAEGMSALETFLLQARAGHCEYFATAATLLLRAAGVPARYASGLAVSEYSALEDAYVARRRHAHAWTLVYVDGRWQDFDATPPDWTSLEEERASGWQRLGDLWDWLGHHFSRWRWREATADATDDAWLWGLLAGLALILLWRLLRRQRVRPARKTELRLMTRPGALSPFYRVLDALAARCGVRPSGEALEAWLHRIGAWDTPGLAEMARWHQRWRFDPAGLSAEEQQRLAAAVTAWLEAEGQVEKQARSQFAGRNLPWRTR